MPPAPAADRWRRVARPGPLRVAVIVACVLGCAYLLLLALVLVPVATGSVAAAAPVGVALLGAVALAALALRNLRIGVWVCDRGVRDVRLLSVATLTWSRLAALEVAQRSVRFGGVLPARRALAVVFIPDDGKPNVTVVTAVSPDFLGRPEAFDMAVDAIERWCRDHRR